jgi:hypothetical protein
VVTGGNFRPDHVFAVKSRKRPSHTWGSPLTVFSVFGSFTALLKSWKGLAVFCAVIALMLSVFALQSDAASVLPCASPAVYAIGVTGEAVRPSGLEWCSDSGTNRFVTNDYNDFVPGSVREVSTNVAVGSGTVVSPMVGDVLVRSLDHDTLIKCTNVLLLRDCENKLMPASPFIRKGYTIAYSDYDKCHLHAPDGSPLFTGQDFEGLYYFRSETVRVADPIPSSAVGGYSFFGLPMGKAVKAATSDFAQRLLESHQAFGHLNFTKLRKMFGLQKGDDPDCAACTIANSRLKPLSKTRQDRSTRANHRVYLDIGFTQDSRYCFQLCVDDFTRESFLDVLDSKKDALESFQKLQSQRDNDHAPYSLAYCLCLPWLR